MLKSVSSRGRRKLMVSIALAGAEPSKAAAPIPVARMDKARDLKGRFMGRSDGGAVKSSWPVSSLSHSFDCGGDRAPLLGVVAPAI